jgi:hypothetical protein
MDDEHIIQILASRGMPYSLSLLQAIRQVANEVAQERKGIEWHPIATAPKDRNILLFGGEIHEGWWDELDYDEFRGERIMGWYYGVAIIDPTNFSPTHWAECPTTPEIVIPEEPTEGLCLQFTQ